ncbi:ECF-type sigma factor [Vibrio sp. Sgm 22]|uniref:ECF-type sigma factor n=1 Tax=unclassified Vibrio TaxID=2614977 RepID=UPI002248A05F|nr:MULTISPECIES: ECF-type sigma factor [unclassified Vibrio]MCX2761055.1 ECF-type sigma factor [Vibrio sp. 14G-20]MCX2777430.1 ECF-type sigma factor [Vibrio sp. Sgm 22]
MSTIKRPQVREGLTALIYQWQQGCKQSEAELYRFAYFRLKELAQVRRYKCAKVFNEPLMDSSTTTTTLIHEAYLKVGSVGKGEIEGTRDFFLMAVKAMQHILINDSWALKADKRQEDNLMRMENALSIECLPVDKRIALEKSLIDFTERYPRQSNVLKLKYYIGLKHKEISELLDCSPSLIEKDLKFAKGWLHDRLAA